MNSPHKRSLHVAGVDHGATPIPLGARVGPLLHSSGISGKDPETSKVPEDAARQVALAFANLRALLAAGGAKLSDVVKVTVYLKDLHHREHVNREWVAMFPDADDRPARHVLKHDLQGGMQIQLEVMAYVQAFEPRAR